MPTNARTSLGQRLRAHGIAKLLLTVGLAAWISVPYFVLQRWVLFPVTRMPAFALDRGVPFVPAAAWLYLSLYLLVPLPPLLTSEAAMLRRFAAGIVVIGLTASVAFLLVPTVTERPDVPSGTDPAFRLVRAADTAGNACPSLHAALAVFAGLAGDRMLRTSPVGWRIALWGWVVAILGATLATKQHVVLDLVAGAALGFAVDAGLPGSAFRRPAP